MTKWQAILDHYAPGVQKNNSAWTNEFIYLLKYTSLAYIVGTGTNGSGKVYCLTKLSVFRSVSRRCCDLSSCGSLLH